MGHSAVSEVNELLYNISLYLIDTAATFAMMLREPNGALNCVRGIQIGLESLYLIDTAARFANMLGN